MEKERLNLGMILDNEFKPDARVLNEINSIRSINGVNIFLLHLNFKKNTLGFKFKEIEDSGFIRYEIQVGSWFRSLSALAYSIPIYHLIFFFLIIKFIKRYKINFIHCHDLAVARSVYWVSKKYNIKNVLDLHEDRPNIMKYYEHTNSFLGKLLISSNRWEKFQKKYVKKFNDIILVTREAKDSYLKRYKIEEHNIIVVPNSVNKYFLEDRLLKEKHDGFNVLYIGDTGYRRGVQDVLKAFALLNDYKDLRLIIAGVSKNDSKLKSYINSDLKNKIEFLGWIPPKQLHNHLKTADLGVSPLHLNQHHDTTYANKVFQYMAYGIPCLLSNTLTQNNLVKEYKMGWIHEEKNIEEIAEKILFAYNNRLISEEFGRNGLNALQKELKWEVVDVELRTLYFKKTHERI